MEIIGTNEFEKDQKSKKTMKIITVFIVLLLIISIALGITIYYLMQEQFKLVVDGKSITNKAGDLFVFNNNKIYVSIKDISGIIGYDYYNGGYKQYSEDEKKCYVQNKNEVCTFTVGSKKIYKNEPEKTDYEYYDLEEDVKKINGKLYTTLEGIGKACNISIGYEKEQNKMTVYTLPYLANYYTNKYTKSAVATEFKNQKAILYDRLVIQNIDNTDKNIAREELKYGVCDLAGNEIVGTKYDKIEFVEGTQEFFITTTEKKVGIITIDGETKVKPQYDEIKQIDKDLNLYVATNNNKQGVIEKNGKILIYLEYEKIGIDSSLFQTNDIKNPYILYNNAIPVKRDGKWGLYDIKGNEILPIEYDGFGCVAETVKDKTLNNILLIPDIKGIVVSKIFEIDNRKKSLFGIVTYLGKEIIPIALETVYSTTTNNRDEYVMINNGKSFNVLDYVSEYLNLDEINKEDKGQTNTQTNTLTNETATNVVSNSVATSTNVVSNSVATSTNVVANNV